MVLRALTWAAETNISGRGDYNCVSFFCFPPCFPASPVTHSSAFIYGRRQMFIHWARRVTSYCAPHAAFLQPSCTCWMHRAQWSMPWSPALWSSWCISVSFPISLCDPCSTSTWKVKSFLFRPALDLITLAVVTDCSRLLFQSHLFLCGYTQQLWEGQGTLKDQENWKY